MRALSESTSMMTKRLSAYLNEQTLEEQTLRFPIS